MSKETIISRGEKSSKEKIRRAKMSRVGQRRTINPFYRATAGRRELGIARVEGVLEGTTHWGDLRGKEGKPSKTSRVSPPIGAQNSCEFTRKLRKSRS